MLNLHEIIVKNKIHRNDCILNFFDMEFRIQLSLHKSTQCDGSFNTLKVISHLHTSRMYLCKLYQSLSSSYEQKLRTS